MNGRGARGAAHLTQAAPASPRPPRWLVAGIVLLLVVLAVFITIRLVSDVPHLVAGTVPADEGDFGRRYVEHPWSAYLHILTGVLFLAGALVQVSYRRRRLGYVAHRRRGRVLAVVGVVACGTAVAFGVPHAFGGSGEAAATVVFAGWMVVCLVLGVAAARRRDIAAHRRWMIRAFTVAIAVGTIRLWLGLLAGPGWLSLQDSFPRAFWLAFTMHVAAGEIWIRHAQPPPDAVTGGESAHVTTTPPLVRFCALAAPTFLLLYGLLRLIDGLDGDPGPGLAWNLGHTLFLIGFVLLGVLAVGMRHLVPATTVGTRVVASVATFFALFGVACFLWVILGDLFPAFHDAAPLPDPLEMFGPVAFQLGVLTLLIMLATARPRRLPVWSPLLVLIGFLLFAVNLDLIPAGALLILAGLTPLTGDHRSAQR